ncbi:hypothetical protein ABVT39_002743, partial [Epinephelus coioides]
RKLLRLEEENPLIQPAGKVNAALLTCLSATGAAGTPRVGAATGAAGRRSGLGAASERSGLLEPPGPRVGAATGAAGIGPGAASERSELLEPPGHRTSDIWTSDHRCRPTHHW